ncbi:SGNH/GDSL hydrolase family protein [Asticcacaulis sp. BYS171W]|uniref:SGNH/GDSL hydrolase family protein n=1 Tax=Asticcacaulis aquaticus TaxID=2984212 RepID=A0ABT5HUX8_9CAUL|nr:SGNH/GDSL hydrolase family protein [Asticcacaulis aquaticus]MDC7683875.1 SGNH/GDSL hydrolase family protein [Asticcacaulis aquaticus]
MFTKACRVAGCLVAALWLVAPAQAGALQSWVPTWYAAPEPAGKADKPLEDMTLRQIVRVSAGGGQVRVRLSNAYGTARLRLDEVRIARRLSSSRIDPTSDRELTFNGRAGVTIAPGAYAISDPVPLKVAANSDLALSVYVAGPTKITTLHDIQRGVLYGAPGRQAGAPELPEGKVDIGIGRAFPWLAEVEVADTPARATIVTFGDSITDGFGIQPDKGGTWPEILSRRLETSGMKLSVVNAGLSGNRLLHHGQSARFGDSGLSRFDRDVLNQPNVGAVIVLLGINDLGHAEGPGAAEYVSAEDMIDGYRQLAARAHERCIRIYVATLTPFKGTVFRNYYSDEKEARRQRINIWLRQGGVFDGVIDFDKALESAPGSGVLKADYDVGDHLHPDDEGAAAMAAAVPLNLFKGLKPGTAPGACPRKH